MRYITADMYNKICELVWLEDVRLQNIVTDKMNFIIKFAPTDARMYIELAEAKAVKNYFDKYVFTILDWLRGFVDD